MQSFSLDQIRSHNTRESLWVVIDSLVFDLTKFASFHPGGLSVLLNVAGTDCTSQFFQIHRLNVLDKYSKLQIGYIEGSSRKYVTPEFGSLSLVPYAEPQWLRKGQRSPYFNEGHYRLRSVMRKFVDEYIIPEALAGEMKGIGPSKKLNLLQG